MADVKHITKTCPYKDCTNKAFVQVVVFEDEKIQAKVDALAKKKLTTALKKLHKEGKHDGR